MKFHPNDPLLEEFYLSQGEEQRALLAHLAGCGRCLIRFRTLTEPPPRVPEACGGEDLAGGYEEVLSCGESSFANRERAISKERASAPGVFVELMRLSAEQRRLLIRNSSRFRTWGLCELLIERCRETVIRDPTGSEELARLALEVAAGLAPSFYRASLIQDLRARAWGYLGNARRVGSDHQGAEEAFFKAESFLQRGSKDPVELAILLDLKASLRRAQRRFDEAQKLLRRAVSIFLRNGHLHCAGRSLVNLSTVHHYAGNLPAAIPLLSSAKELIDPESEPRLFLCARHNLCDYLASSGRFSEAQRAYRETRPFYRSFPDDVTQLRRKWVKGKISLGLGRTAQAERLFLATRDGFIAEGMAYDAALVSLELAILYARKGRIADLRRFAQEVLPIFSSLQIHREALAALSFLQKALEAERATLELVSRVADFFRRAKHDPELRFEP